MMLILCSRQQVHVRDRAAVHGSQTQWVRNPDLDRTREQEAISLAGRFHDEIAPRRIPDMDDGGRSGDIARRLDLAVHVPPRRPLTG
jgi:hypothetical protein